MASITTDSTPTKLRSVDHWTLLRNLQDMNQNKPFVIKVTSPQCFWYGSTGLTNSSPFMLCLLGSHF